MLGFYEMAQTFKYRRVLEAGLCLLFLILGSAAGSGCSMVFRGLGLAVGTAGVSSSTSQLTQSLSGPGFPLGRNWNTGGYNALAVDATGNIYTATNDGKIQKHDSTGKHLSELVLPTGRADYLTTDRSGNLYAVDSHQRIVTIYDPSGNQVASWLGDPTPNNDLGGIAVNSQGNIYVAEPWLFSNPQVTILDSSGSLLGQISSPWGSPGYLSFPTAVYIDSADQIYVVCGGNSTVQIFDSNGNFLRKLGTSSGSGPGQFNSPTAVSVDSQGVISVLDSFNYRIQKFDQNGNFLSQWGSQATAWPAAPGTFLSPPSALVAEPSGQFLVMDGSGTLQRFDSSGNWIELWGSQTSGGSAPGQLSRPIGIALDSSGNIFVSDMGNYRVEKYGPAGNFLGNFGTGSYGAGNGSFNSIGALAVDPTGNVYVADPGNQVIQIFDSNFSFLYQWSGFNYPYGIMLNPAGGFYVAEEGNNDVLMLDSSGTTTSQWGAPGTAGNGQFNYVQGGALDQSGNVYVIDCDSNNDCRIQKFDSQGNFIFQWGSLGTGPGQFMAIRGVAVDLSGNVYVTDAMNNNVQKFDSSGNLLLSWGNSGSNFALLHEPYGIAVDATGNVYVADAQNRRVLKFDSSGNPLFQ